MSRILTRVLAVVGALAIVAVATAAVLFSSGSDEAEAHGTTQAPPSRVYSCRFETPDNSRCQNASSQNPQSIYDWMEVNIGDADGRHTELIPDGQLCSAGREKYAAFDEPGEWPRTHLEPNSGGQYDIVYTNTAPHATAYYRFMITKPGFDARTDTLGWADLEEVYESEPLTASEQNTFSIDLPEREDPAILYVIWQRSDSPEAFYACSDVTIGSSGSGAPSPSDPAAPDGGDGASDSDDTGAGDATDEGDAADAGDGASDDSASGEHDHGEAAGEAGTDHEGHGDDAAGDKNAPDDGASTGDAGDTAPETEADLAPMVDGIATSETVTADWDTGYCSEIRVENTTSSAIDWEVHYDPDGTIDTVWNARGDEHFTGEDWNSSVAAGEWTTFGMCVTKS